MLRIVDTMVEAESTDSFIDVELPLAKESCLLSWMDIVSKNYLVTYSLYVLLSTTVRTVVASSISQDLIISVLWLDFVFLSRMAIG
ncbi:hypothetical protein BCON_0233g00100 [Botryotinia convoluta]|uniref:Uncharacterized protein n=1 Tax=Botryotinia convoluta TaxID=54673 RepID=A0A4Z1HPJ8_9HELO|nr:hypothetical protein BCON_0233g00100 [Botryotinia convoluta]